MSGVFIGTLILWALSALVVGPMAQGLVQWQLARRPCARADGAAATVAALEAEEVKRLTDRAYIATSVLVLGIAGMVGGLAGFYFIGLSRQARQWPGLLAFIFASFAGLMLRGQF